MAPATTVMQRPVRRPVSARLTGFRPYRMHAFLLVYTPVLLFVDGRLASLSAQLVLGVATFALLWFCAKGLDPHVRRQIWICVPVATMFEVLGSLVWGGYHYQLGNIPLYVPPGHGLVFLFGITAGSLPFIRRHGRHFTHAVLALCTAWAIAGVSVLPLLTHRVDVQGALCLPLFAWCLLRSRRATMFAGIWVATTTLELAGTWAGAWTWLAVAPWSHLPSGNPPSAIAAGYAIIDGSVALLSPLLLGLAGHARGRLRTARESRVDPPRTATATPPV